MTNDDKSQQIVTNDLSHSQLIKKRKRGQISPSELDRLHAFEAAANARHRRKEPRKSNGLSPADRIAILEKRMRKPGISDKNLKALSIEIRDLTGERKTYATKPEQRRQRDAALAPKQPSQVKYPVERDGVDSWVTFEELDAEERQQLEVFNIWYAEYRKTLPKNTEEWEIWDKQNPGRREESLRAHGVPVRPVITEPVKQSDEAERRKLLALLLPTPKTADILLPEQLPGPAPRPMTPDEVNRFNEFWEFNKTL